jgi:hypothetical protein
MPSYIELDKQGSFAPSSDASKVILGINNDNLLQLTNSSGQSMSVAGLPYQVYTALLTQSGGDDPNGIAWNDAPNTLTIGVTYEINVNTGGFDVTNIGSPNNEVGTKFVATGTTPANWGTGNLYYNNGAPVVKVLENTIGNIWWTYIQDGFYIAYSNGLFTLNKTFCQGVTSTAEDGTGFKVITVTDNNANGCYVLSTNPILEAPFNDYLTNTPIEIRVYN